MILFFIILFISIAGTLSIFENYSKQENYSISSKKSFMSSYFNLPLPGWIFIIFSLISIISLSYILKIGTFRMKKIPLLTQSSIRHLPSHEIVYNHREMDEVIFEVLFFPCHFVDFFPFLFLASIFFLLPIFYLFF